jgi:LysR family transcriptional regulator, regulator of abg operon
MKLNQLRDLVAIVECGSLRAAARQLALAQSGLTRSIRTLEKECEGDLFERDVKGMVLTPIGEMFYRRARSALSELERAKEEVHQARGGTSGSITIGLSIMPHLGMLPYAIKPFSDRFPGVVVKVIEGLYPAIEPGLRNGSIDFYLGAAPHGPTASGLLCEHWLENLRVVVGRKGHPLSKARNLKQLTKAAWLTTSLDLNASQDLETLFASFGLPTPSVRFQAHTGMTVLTALANSDLLAMMPQQWMASPLYQNTLQVIPVSEALPAPPIIYVRRADMPLTPAAEYFLDLMRRRA